MLEVAKEGVLALVLQQIDKVVKCALPLELLDVRLDEPRQLYLWLRHRQLDHFAQGIWSEWLDRRPAEALQIFGLLGNDRCGLVNLGEFLADPLFHGVQRVVAHD